VRAEDAFAIGHDDVVDPLAQQQFGDRDARRAGTSHRHLEIRQFLPDQAQRVVQGREDDDRGAVLVVMEDRDVELLLQPLLDLEALGCRDVLEVDAAVARGDRLDDTDDLVRIGRVQAHRPRVDAGEPLEQQGLALHHRHRRLGADVAQSEHRRPVGHDRDGVALDGQTPSVLGVVRDGPTHARDAGGVRHRQIVAGLQRHRRADLHLAVEVHQERAVARPVDVRALDLFHRRPDPLRVICVAGVGGHVHDQNLARGVHPVHRDHHSGRLTDRRRHPPDR
jgi:hypothetical protein